MENNDHKIIKFPSKYNAPALKEIPDFIQNYDIVFFTDNGIRLVNTIYLRDICSSIQVANAMVNYIDLVELGRKIGYLVDSYIKVYNQFGICIVDYSLEVHQ